VVVFEDSDLFVFRAHVCVGRWANRMLLEIIPITISIGTSCMISNEIVVWIGDPEASRSLVSIKQTPRPFGHHDQIAFNMVSPLDTILNEDCVSFGVVGNILNDSQIFGSVDGESSVERQMD